MPPSAGGGARGSSPRRCTPSDMAAPDREWLEGGVTAVPGVLAAGVAAGIKPSGKKDLALIYSSAAARVAAQFTSNQVKGAPVLVSMEHVRGGQAQAIVASSGCANVCTGERGIRDAREMTKLVGDLLRIPAGHVLVASTGGMGVRLPMGRVRAAAPQRVKRVARQACRGRDQAGPTTANRPPKTRVRRLEDKGDGRGGEKPGDVAGRGAAGRRDALVADRSVGSSPLVKTAINGADPNWGRIMMALGKSAARVEQEKVSILFQDERVVERGMLREGVRLERVREIMGGQEYDITIDLGLGRGEERVFTCDLSEEYVRFNGKYTT